MENDTTAAINERLKNALLAQAVKKPKKTRRARGFTTSVHLSGEVGRWCAEQAKANFRSLEGEIQWCVAQAMEKEDGK